MIVPRRVYKVFQHMLENTEFTGAVLLHATFINKIWNGKKHVVRLVFVVSCHYFFPPKGGAVPVGILLRHPT